MKKTLIFLGIIFVAAAAVILVVGRVFYPDNIAETAPDGGAKNLKTRVYQIDQQTAEKAVREIVPTLSTYGSNWKITNESSDAVKGKIIKTEVPVLFFTDDLEVYIKQTPEKGEVSIDVRSNSRVGKSDFGENARHVRKLLDALDERFLTKRVS